MSRVKMTLQVYQAEGFGKHVRRARSGRGKILGYEEMGRPGKPWRQDHTQRRKDWPDQERGSRRCVFQVRWGEEAPEWENYCKICLWAACWLLSGQSPDTVAFMVQEQGGNGFTVPPVCVTKFLQCFGVLNMPCQSLSYLSITQRLEWMRLWRGDYSCVG